MPMTNSLAAPPVPPPAPKAVPHRQTVHGCELTDDFAWIKAENWKEVLRDPGLLPADIRAFLEAENAYADAFLAPLAGLRDALVAEMRGRIREDDSTVPSPDGPFAYYVRYREKGQHPLHCRVPRGKPAGTDETVMLDGDALAQGLPFFQLGGPVHSDDHRLLAWSSDEAGSEFFTLRVRDLATLEDRGDVVRDTTGAAVWDKAGRSFLYVAVDENHRPRAVRRHVLGAPADEDTTLYEETADGWFVDVEASQSGDYVFITVSDHETSEVRILDRSDFTRPFVLVAERETGLRYEVEHQGDRFVILTNAQGAEDFKIMTAPLDAPGRTNWTDLVPHRPGRIILSILPLAGHLLRAEREHALPRIVVRDMTTGEEHAIAFQEEAYSLWLRPGFEYETTTIRFVYSSMTTPAETWDYDVASRERVLLKRQEVPSGHDPAAYVTRRLSATAPDGAQVPVSLLHRRDLVLDGSAPCLLYGYGAYGHAVPAGFDTRCLSLVDRGFVYAIAHIRGGTDKGWAWYTNGKREHKENTFRDFIAAGHMLVEAGYTSKGRIVAQGRSAGGMLMGAVANMAPELFAAILAEVPFVDVLNTMLDASLPLTPPEWPEWGNPIESPEDFARIRGYSPYDRVAAQAYPAILAVGGLTDPRVTYWEPAKWIARLRSVAEGGPFVLATEMEAGHGGASGRFDRLKEVARSYAFALAAVGLATARGEASG
ncbi:MAG: S9 family peptidase [Alsobacter sp.]